MNSGKFLLFLISGLSLALLAEVFTLPVAASGRLPKTVSALTAEREPHNFDALHYIIRTKFDRANKIIIGDTSIKLKPLAEGFKTFTLDAVNFKVESVTLEPSGANLDYQVSPTNIKITLDKEYAPSETIEVRIKYRALGHGIPTAQDSGGVFFIPEIKEKNSVLRAAQIWTQGEPEDNHEWFPGYDLPDDKAMSEQFITVEKDETAIANGDLLETTENPDGTKTFHYKMEIPHSSYLISFIIGKYTKVKDTHGAIPLAYYVYPGTEAIVPKAFAKTPRMMEIFEKLTGIPFPYQKYDQTLVRSFTFGGMENITATTLLDTEIYAASIPTFVLPTEDLVSHELAHSWFGDLVTCKNWSHLWLNEGFATFMEAVYKEQEYDKAQYTAAMTANAAQYFGEYDAGVRHPLVNPNAKPNLLLFDATTYKKGGFVLNMLRREVGDEVFWKAVNFYLNQHKFGNVETKDLQAAFESTSGKDLNWFFEQWVYKAGHPILKIKSKYTPPTKTYTVTITQTQKPDSQTPEVFRFNTEIEIILPKGKQTEKIAVTKRTQTFSFKVAAKPTRLIFDPQETVLDKTEIE